MLKSLLSKIAEFNHYSLQPENAGRYAGFSALLLLPYLLLGDYYSTRFAYTVICSDLFYDYYGVSFWCSFACRIDVVYSWQTGNNSADGRRLIFIVCISTFACNLARLAV